MKTLKQIQEENREFIIDKVFPNYDFGYKKRLLNEDPERYKNDIYFKDFKKFLEMPLTANHVLLATFRNGFYKENKSKYNREYQPFDIEFKIEHCQEYKNNLNFIMTTEYTEASCEQDEFYDKDMLFSLDLTKETLEEQSEKTQRKINEFLNGTIESSFYK